MSKMRALNREKIKTTISGLALMIAIGSVGGIGSYAYFTDQGQVNNGLEVTMGTFDVELTEKCINTNVNSTNYDSTLIQTFKIKNNGSLDQNVSLQINNFSIPKELKPSLKLEMNYEGKEVMLEGNPSVSGNMGNYLNLVYSDGSGRVNLKSGKSISCKLAINMNIDNEKILGKFDGDKVTFDTNVKSVQINAPGGNK